MSLSTLASTTALVETTTITLSALLSQIQASTWAAKLRSVPGLLGVFGVSWLAVSAVVRQWRLRGTPPGSLGIWQVVLWMQGPTEFVNTRKERWGPIFKTNMIFSPAVHLTGEHAKLMLKNHKVGWPEHWGTLLGRSSLTMLNGARHKCMRAAASSAFTEAALQSYMPVMQELTRKHLEMWAAESSASGAFNPRNAIKAYTFDVAERIILGTTMGNSESMLATFEAWGKGLEALIPWNLPFTAFRRSLQARASLLSECERIIERKRAMLSGDGSHQQQMRDMLGLVMSSGMRGEPMTQEELLDFCLVIMFAGHDTTTATMQTLLHFLHANPGTMEELRAEVAGVWDGHEAMTWKQVQACQSGKCGRFIAEVLRVVPPVANIHRTATEDMEVLGYRIPKGWKITANCGELHQTYHSLDLDMSLAHSSMVQLENCPFGVGARMCIGYKFAKLELMIWLMELLSQYQIEVKSSTRSVFPMAGMRVVASFSKRR